MTKRTYKIKICPACKKEFQARFDGKEKYQKHCSRFCSVKMQHKRKEIGLEYNNPNYIDGRTTKIYHCKCGKQLNDYRAKRCFKCWIKILRQQSTPFFKPFLNNPVWLKNRSLALERDNYKCQWCGEKTSLVVHHKILKQIRGHALSNLETLCRSCHTYLHNITTSRKTT